jgi:glycerate dehydrogenase
MRAVILDVKGMEDFDLSPISKWVDELVVYELTPLEKISERMQGFDIVITNKTQLDHASITSSSELKLICVLATGTNVVDKAAAASCGIPVCNAVAYGVDSVVQHVFSLILALHTNLLTYHSDVQRGKWQKSEQFCFLDHPIIELKGRALGIIGYGNLGRGVARIAEAFGMRVLVSESFISGSTGSDGRVPFSQLLAESDVITLHCPLTEQTENLFNAKTLSSMKAGAFLINAARGGIVDESALVEALQNGHLAGAAVDVLTQEPPLNGNILLDVSLPNLIVTPHIAWGSSAARERIIQQTGENIEGFINNQLVHEVR